MTTAWQPVGDGPGPEVCWEIDVQPAGGSGYLTEFDVDVACRGVPDGASVELVLYEMDDFSGAAVGVLARRLATVQVRFVIRASARAAGGSFVSMFEQARHHYLSVEAGRLADRSA